MEENKNLDEDIFTDIGMHILSATYSEKDDYDMVILKCAIAKKDESYDSDDCIVYVDRSMYHAIIDEILDRKADYHDSTNGSFAGVGNVSFSVFYEFPEDERPFLCDRKYDEENDDYTVIENKVRAFIANDFLVDIEHG